MKGDERKGQTVEAYVEVAKMVCDICPVRGKCRNLGAEETWGVWGGTTYDERRKGTYVPSSRVLNPRYLHIIPDHAPNIRVDIKALSNKVKRYADLRDTL